MTACHIPGKSNVVADDKSRNFDKEDAELMLDKQVLQSALSKLNFNPDIDLLASRLNTQFDKYCSFKPHPGAAIVDAFTFS